MTNAEFCPLYKEDLDYIITTKGIDALSGKTILITGSTGLIGTCLIDALMRFNAAGRNVRIIACGRNESNAQERFDRYFGHPMFSFLKQDVTEPFPEDLTADFIVPLASNTHPLAYSNFPVETMMINILGARHALELASRCDASVLYPSSVEVYGNAADGREMSESYTGKLDLSKARACYTESKRSAEALCQSYAAEKGVSVKIARLSRVFGPTMQMSDSKASSQFIKKALAGEDIVLKSKGEQFFSYTYVADAVSALLFVMLNGETGEAYNISCRACDMHLKDFARCCADYAGTKVIFDIPSETESQGYSIAQTAIMDCTKLETLGWKGKYDYKDSIWHTMDILRSNIK